MKTLAFFGNEPFKKGYPVQWVKAPDRDPTATCFAFGAPYRRVRFDKRSKSFYVLTDGKAVPVLIATVEV